MKRTSYNVSKSDLFNVSLPIQTNTYKPVEHKAIIDGISEQIDKKNIYIESEIYRSGRGGLQIL